MNCFACTAGTPNHCTKRLLYSQCQFDYSPGVLTLQFVFAMNSCNANRMSCCEYSYESMRVRGIYSLLGWRFIEKSIPKRPTYLCQYNRTKVYVCKSPLFPFASKLIQAKRVKQLTTNSYLLECFPDGLQEIEWKFACFE